jgi:hypothetical protein
MNERIYELAEQAGWDNHHSKFDTRIEKFAELIVRESARVAKIIEPEAGDDYAFGRTWAGIDILKHFGVVE